MSSDKPFDAAGWEIFDQNSELWAARSQFADEPIAPSDCLRVKTPSQGLTTFDIDGDPAKEIKGILAWVGKRSVVWPHETMTGSGSDPVFVTDDLVTARRVGDDVGDLDMDGVEKAMNADGTYRWRELPFVYPNGNRDRESRILYVLRQGDVLPLAINASAASVYSINSYLKRLARPVWRHYVSVSLTREEGKTGIPFAMFHLKTLGILDAAHGEIIKNLYSRGIAAMSGVSIDRPVSLPATKAPPAITDERGAKSDGGVPF
jgi:hypothetical protein